MTLRFKLAPRAPLEACKIAYVKGNPITVNENVSVLDLSYTDINNVSIYTDSQILVDWGSGETIDTNDVVISSVSVLDKAVSISRPLFYKHKIGGGLFELFSDAADDIDLDKARAKIRETIKILDINNNEISSPLWDVVVTQSNANGRYDVDIYVDRRASQGQVFKIKYHAFEVSSGTFFPNHIEVLNPVPYIVEGVDYTLAYNFVTNDYTISFVSPISSPAVNLFTEDVSGSIPITVNATDIVIGSSTIPHNNRNAHEIAHEINQADEGILAMPATSGLVSSIKAGVFTVEPHGLQILADESVQVRYGEETRIRLRAPLDVSSAHPWHARVNIGRFSNQDMDLMYSIPEFHEQSWSPVHGKPYKDVVSERIDAYFLNDRTYSDVFRTNNRPIHPDAYPVITYNGIVQQNAIKDIDRANGIVFLNNDIPLEGEAEVSYVYEERDFVYKALDLNPTAEHNPDILNKFIGLYLIPSIRGGEAFAKTVYHMIRDTEQEIIDDIALFKYDDSAKVEAFLMGIYQVTESIRFNEIDVVDIRQYGGGVVKSPENDIGNRQPEWSHYRDIGRMDGMPFQGASALVIQLPSEIIGGQKDRDMSLDVMSMVDGTEFLDPSGLFTRDQIQDILYRYVPSGHMIIDGYRSDLNG